VISTLLCALCAGSPAGDVPILVSAETANPCTFEAGTLRVNLRFLPKSDIDTDYQLRVGLDLGSDTILTEDITLDPPTSTWRRGEPIRLTYERTLPPELTTQLEEDLVLLVGFLDPATGDVHGPRGLPYGSDGLADVAYLPTTAFAPDGGQARFDAILERAKELKRAGDGAGAWRELELGLRSAHDDPTKERFRDRLLELGKYEPAAITELEQAIVRGRIGLERARYLRLMAGHLYDRGMLHGALRLLETAGGALAEAADGAVIGAVDDEQRVMRRQEDIRERLITERSEEQEAEVERLIEEHGLSADLEATLTALIAAKDFPVALELSRELRKSDDAEVERRAWDRIPELEDAWVAHTPAEDQSEVETALTHPAFPRTKTVASHCFLFIGPEELVDGIPADSKLNYDIAYVFLTDLFGRLPNPDGDRITVYFKELWDFGGGVGGGKTIDIGNANPSPKRPVRVDNGLLYHELTHCVDDTRPVFGGFTEGLANLGAAYVFEALDSDGDALHSFDANLKQFQEFFLDRDLEYWRIQEYGPSCGFFLHFIDTYAKRGKADHDWCPMRRFFREYRDAANRDGREPQIVRGLAHHLMRAFGPAVFDDLMRFGFPLKEADRELLELEAMAYTNETVEDFEDQFEAHPNSPLPRDLRERELLGRSLRGAEQREFGRLELGVLYDYQTLGPFFVKSADPGACVFPPEDEIVLDQKVRALRSTRDDWTALRWKTPERDSNVSLDNTGWLEFDYKPYGQTNAAIYALTSVTVEADTFAICHLRANDDVSLFINGTRAGSYRGRGTNGSSQTIRWRGPHGRAPDAIRFGVFLFAGRNEVLIKIKNRYGKAGCMAALSLPNGRPLSFSSDSEQPETRPTPATTKWKETAKIDSRSWRSKTVSAVGGFKTRNRALSGSSNSKGVGWRMFTVRPGFPKDSPSNLTWIKEKLTREHADARVEIRLSPADRAPKLLLTFQGEGGSDGLSGWNLILIPHGKTHVSARLERYDRLVYQTEALPLPEAEESRLLTASLANERFTATLDGLVLFDEVTVNDIPGKTRIGIATWGEEPAIERIELSKPR
jgi:hypothetical protein